MMFKLPLITGLGALLIGAAASWWVTSDALSAKHKAEIQSIRAEAAEQYAAATQRAVEVEREHAQLATNLEVQHEKATRQLAAIRADNRRLAAAAGGLRDPYPVAPTCPLPADAGSTVDPAAAPAVAGIPNAIEGVVLSDETTEFLIEFAYDADRAAEYASTCHQWVKELKELQ